MERVTRSSVGALVVLAAALPSASSGLLARDPAVKNLTLHACVAATEPAECGTFRVREDRTRTSARILALNLIVLRARAGPANEAVFLFAGGPGQAATDLVGVVRQLLEIRQTRDVVFVDQRGTGGSHRLDCDLIDPSSPASAFGAVFDVSRVAHCRDALSLRADLAQYTTAAAVADADEVRAALGYDRVLLYGGSYGTRVVQAYIKAYPSRVRAAVLDGVLPLDDGPISFARSLQRAVDGVFDRCAADPGCAGRHPQLARQFGALVERLRAGPIATSVQHTDGRRVSVQLSLGDFAYAVRGLLYSQRGRHDLPAMIADAAATRRLDAFAQFYWHRALAFRTTLAHGLHLSVLCAEDIPFAGDAEVDAATSGTFMGRYLFDEYRRACGRWPRARLATDARMPASASVPTLLLSGELDPVTPPAFAEAVSRGLSSSRHLVVPGGAHGSLGSCARSAVARVLATGTITGLPAVCQ
jgi:pimeloyl-ACP methyl ester carboxylesterase